MIRLFGCTCGLIAFSATILVGLTSGGEPATVIPRAVTSLIGGVAMGCVAGWIGWQIVKDGAAQQAKAELDEEAGESESNSDGGVTVVGG